MFLVPTIRESRQLSRLFDDAFERFLGPVTSLQDPDLRNPALDVSESDRVFTVKLDMPGVSKDEVKVSIEGRQVTVQAQSERKEEKKDGERVIYRERTASSYARTFTLPMEVDQAESGAKLEHGVLTLTLPKRSARAAAHITIK